MNIVDHLSVGVPSIEAGTAFYDDVMNALGCDLLVTTEGFAAYGKEAPQFLLMLPYDGKESTSGNGTHIAFIAKSEAVVDAFHHFAMKNGGACEGEPGLRPAYPKRDIYTAFVRDPFGNKLEAIYNGFAV